MQDSELAFLSPGQELLSLPGGSVSFDSPADVDVQMVGGQSIGFSVGIRKVGEPSNAQIDLKGFRPGQIVTLANVHESGFFVKNPLVIPQSGSYSAHDETAIPESWPLGNWQVQVEYSGDNGILQRELLGKFKLLSSSGQSKEEAESDAPLLAGFGNNIALLAVLVTVGALIFRKS